MVEKVFNKENMKFNDILDALPYSDPFLFVDSLISVSENGVEGEYTFKTDEYFYKGHFKDNPITPGVMLIECMAQIGLVCLGIYLNSENKTEVKIAFSNTEVDFLKPVYPGETVKVISEKEYFRFNKLKCKVRMLNVKNEVICNGTLSGLII